jgi:hypothetical protein
MEELPVKGAFAERIRERTSGKRTFLLFPLSSFLSII